MMKYTQLDLVISDRLTLNTSAGDEVHTAGSGHLRQINT